MVLATATLPYWAQSQEIQTATRPTPADSLNQPRSRELNTPTQTARENPAAKDCADCELNTVSKPLPPAQQSTATIPPYDSAQLRLSGIESVSTINPQTNRTSSVLADLVADRMLLRTAPNGGTEVTAPVAGQQYYFHIEWRNAGPDAANGFRVELRLNGNALCAGDFSAAPNTANIVWCITALTWPSGNNTVQGVLDVNNVIAETNENNNSTSRTYTGGGGGQADLVADRMLLRTAPNSGTEVTAPVAGQQYYVHFEWRNAGSVAANGFRVELRLNGTALCAGDFNAPANSSSTTWCLTALTWPSGSNTIQGVLDVNNSIAESNENNNSAQQNYGGGPTVPDIEVSPTSLTINQTTMQEQRGGFEPFEIVLKNRRFVPTAGETITLAQAPGPATPLCDFAVHTHAGHRRIAAKGRALMALYSE